MSADTKQFVENCRTCCLAGKELINTKNRVIKTSGPNQIWEIDLIGRIQNEGRNSFIFIAQDHYSKYIESRVMRTKDAYSTAKAIKELIIEKHGTPTTILSDNGCEFNNSEVNKLKGQYNIEWIYTSPYHHETVGSVERANQTLINKLKKLSNFFQKGWETKLAAATAATNNSFNRAIGSTPTTIMYGKIPDLTIDAKLNQTCWTESLTRVRKERDKHFERYSERDIKKGERTCRHNLKLGQDVAIFRQTGISKLGPQWKSGYVICEEVPPDAYIVRDERGRRLRVNKKHIKSFPVGQGGVVKC